MRYAPNEWRAQGAMEKRPAVKKVSTVTKHGKKIFKEPKLTMGLDLRDRTSHYCILDEAGNVILEHSVAPPPKGILQVFSRIPRSRTAMSHEVIVAHARSVRLIAESSRKDVLGVSRILWRSLSPANLGELCQTEQPATANILRMQGRK
jgi:hypothetical protein